MTIVTTLLKTARSNLALPLASALLIAGAAGTAQAQDSVRFGSVGGLSNESIAVAVALHEGLYEDAGLDIEIVEFAGGGAAIQALVGGAVDVCICAPEHIIRLRNRGVDATVALPLDNRTGYALFGPADSEPIGIEDLAGKRVGITSPGSKTDALVRLALSRNGLTPDTDVEIISVGGTANQLTALVTNNIAGGVITGVDALQAEQDGHPIIYDWREQSLPNLGLLATEGWISANQDTAERLVTATHEGAQRAVADRDLRIEILTELYPQATPDFIELAVDRLVVSTVTDPVFTEEEFDAIQADILELEPELSPITYDEFNRNFVSQ